jgi:hypothetical protein
MCVVKKKQALAIANGSTACMAFLEATSKFNINFSGENKSFSVLWNPLIMKRACCKLVQFC